MYRATIAIFAALAAAAVASSAGQDARAKHRVLDDGVIPTATVSWAPVEPTALLPSPRLPPPLLAMLVETHTDERIPLDESSPSDARFSLLLADRVAGEAIAFDPRLPALLRALAHKYRLSRIEIVSGYRSAKLNEAMRQMGRHVAVHSQHSLGNALDFRIVPSGEARALDPRALEQDIRDLGWDGGIGCYAEPGDWFVHADVGANRRWEGN